MSERAEGQVCKLRLSGPPDKALGTGCCFVFTECPILGSLSILRDKDVNHYLDNLLLYRPSSVKSAQGGVYFISYTQTGWGTLL